MAFVSSVQPDLIRLKSVLLTSGLQTKDNPTFQVINGLIDAVKGVQKSFTKDTKSLAVIVGGTVTFTKGSVLFAGPLGVYSQDNSNFFWDDLNDRLGIGTNIPSSGLHISQPASGRRGIQLSGNGVLGSPSTDGVILTLGYTAAGNRQLWLTDSARYGDASYNSFRYIVGFDVPSIDGINNDGSVQKNITLGYTNTNVGVGFNVVTITQATINAKLHIHGGGTSNGVAFKIEDSGATVRVTIQDDGKFGLGISSPTASLHIKAGTTAANTAPLKLNSGSLLTSPEVGAIEFLTDAYYATITTGAARKTFAFLESPALVTPNIGVASGVSLSLSNTINLPSTGAASTAGTAILVGGTVTVNTTAMTATAILCLHRKTAGGTIGDLTYTQVNGTSFTINSASATDTSTVVWHIIETH